MSRFTVRHHEKWRTARAGLVALGLSMGALQQAAAADVLVDHWGAVGPGQMMMQKFLLYTRAYVTITYEKGLAGLLMTEEACDSLLGASGVKPAVLETSDLGIMNRLLTPGTYCVFLANREETPVQTRLRVEGERR